MELDERLANAVSRTEVIRPPRQALATFGVTTVSYHLLTEPVYTEVVSGKEETVVREGRVVAERPQVVTPFYLMEMEGFSPEARRYLERMMQEEGPSSPGLLYRYRNEPAGLSIVSEPLSQVAARLVERLDREGAHLAAVIRGVDELWDVSLMKFIHQLTFRSLHQNVREMHARGLLDVDRRGVPRDARERIEDLFQQVRAGRATPDDLRSELVRWGVWEEYEDRFLAMFRRR